MIQCFDIRCITLAGKATAQFVGQKLLEAVLRDGTVYLYVPELAQATRAFRRNMELVYLFPADMKQSLEKPEFNFQVGLTGSQREKPIALGGKEASLQQADPKQRFFFRTMTFHPSFPLPISDIFTLRKSFLIFWSGKNRRSIGVEKCG